MKPRLKKKSERRLVKAAETELFLVHKDAHSRLDEAHFETVFEDPFFSGAPAEEDSVDNRDEIVIERPTTEELEDHAEEVGFLGRCNISCIDLSAPPKPKKKAVKTSPPPRVGKCSHNRRVVFHKYDELIDDDGKKDYIYSLHDREVEEEDSNFDMIDKVEGAVSDFGYFFSSLTKDLGEEAKARILRLRKQKKKSKKKASTKTSEDAETETRETTS